MKNRIKITMIACIAILASCSSEPTLQEYFVDHHQDKDFIAVDVPTSLLDTKKVELSAEEKEALQSIKKINFLALKLKESNKARYEEEKTKINTILNAKKYETLMRFGTKGTKGVLKYTGSDDDIDEVIVFGSNKDQGLALVRVLGNDMKAENIAMLVKAIEKGDFDIDGLKEITGVLSDK